MLTRLLGRLLRVKRARRSFQTNQSLRITSTDVEAGAFRVRVLVVNCKRGGYDTATRFHDHEKLMRMVSVVDKSPHVIFLGECTRYLDNDQEPLLEVLRRLGTLWGTVTDADGRAVPSVQYQAWISDVPGSINVPGLLIDTRYITPLRRYGHDGRKIFANGLEAVINGHTFLLKSVHWNGSSGPVGFDLQADQDGQLGGHDAILAGDFNARGSAGPKPAHWGRRCLQRGVPWKLSQKGLRRRGRWITNTQAYDRFLEHGWWDAAEAAGDFTSTVNDNTGDTSDMAIDHIAITRHAPISLVSGTFRVHIPQPGNKDSDHCALSAEFDIPAAT